MFMKAFYASMTGHGKCARDALKDARLALIESDTYSNPYYWAPFIMIGTEKSPWR
jgi:CHAT domain-containing protein